MSERQPIPPFEAKRKITPQFDCELWSINRWLRWTGWRLHVVVDLEKRGDDRTRIGLGFWGWKGLL